MKRHTEFGALIISEHDSDLLSLSSEIALTHHEKWDGSGYPFGLKEEDIPIEARIVAMADVFDALTSERPYKKAWTVEAALDYQKEQKGRHFDPTLVDLFQTILPEILQIKERFAEE